MMFLAYQKAQEAYKDDEVPIGAVITRNDTIIGLGYNQTISTNDSTAHAEIVAIRSANKKLANYRLTDCILYTTLEPCLMCSGAIIHSRIKKIFYAAKEPKSGVISSNLGINGVQFTNHKFMTHQGILEKESSCLLKKFFKEKRINKKK